jgi:hypothetical protein
VLWVLGAVCALAGVFVYMELGLSIPRWPIDGEKIATPRSGEALNYVCSQLCYLMKCIPLYSRGSQIFLAVQLYA